jgi:hypothetical protein
MFKLVTPVYRFGIYTERAASCWLGIRPPGVSAKPLNQSPAPPLL